MAKKAKKPGTAVEAKTTRAYFTELSKWGKRVRRDIKYVEKFLKRKYPNEFTPADPPDGGDPGDPPHGPW